MDSRNYDNDELIYPKDLECPISLLPIESEGAVQLSCGHIFSAPSISSLRISGTANRNNCALCRQEVISEVIDPTRTTVKMCSTFELQPQLFRAFINAVIAAASSKGIAINKNLFSEYLSQKWDRDKLTSQIFPFPVQINSLTINGLYYKLQEYALQYPYNQIGYKGQNLAEAKISFEELKNSENLQNILTKSFAAPIVTQLKAEQNPIIELTRGSHSEPVIITNLRTELQTRMHGILDEYLSVFEDLLQQFTNAVGAPITYKDNMMKLMMLCQLEGIYSRERKYLHEIENLGAQKIITSGVNLLHELRFRVENMHDIFYEVLTNTTTERTFPEEIHVVYTIIIKLTDMIQETSTFWFNKVQTALNNLTDDGLIDADEALQYVDILNKYTAKISNCHNNIEQQNPMSDFIAAHNLQQNTMPSMPTSIDANTQKKLQQEITSIESWCDFYNSYLCDENNIGYITASFHVSDVSLSALRNILNHFKNIQTIANGVDELNDFVTQTKTFIAQVADIMISYSYYLLSQYAIMKAQNDIRNYNSVTNIAELTNKVSANLIVRNNIMSQVNIIMDILNWYRNVTINASISRVEFIDLYQGNAKRLNDAMNTLDNILPDVTSSSSTSRSIMRSRINTSLVQDNRPRTISYPASEYNSVNLYHKCLLLVLIVLGILDLV